jgi:hypothetical protein
MGKETPTLPDKGLPPADRCDAGQAGMGLEQEPGIETQTG